MSSKGHFKQIAVHKAPLVTAGDITPEALCSWEMGCKQYFRIKTITTADQVANVAWNLQDLHVQDWYSNDTDRLNGLSFDAFMLEVVTVRGYGLFFSLIHLPPLADDSPFTFTILVFFFPDTYRYIVW